MRLPILTLLFAAACLAQSGAAVFQKAPPAQDEALRKRATAFYQTHVDGKTRQAMAMVDEEAQDTFFDMQKPKLMSFEIQQITYAKDFQSAAVLIVAEREIAVPFGGVQVMKVPMESHWKQVGGEWRWFLPKGDCKDTPFGCVPTNGATTDPKAAEAIKKKIAEMSKPGAVVGQYGFSKNVIEMTTGGEAQVAFKNEMDGWVQLKFLQPFDDPELELVDAEQQVKPFATANLTVRVKKGVKIAKAREIIVPLYVQPFNRLAGLRVLLHPGTGAK